MPTITPTFTSGPDSYTADVATDTYILDFLAGADLLNLVRGTVTATMGEGNDSAAVRGGESTVDGGVGDDLFNIYNGTTTIQGGVGSDRLIVRAGLSLTADLDEDADRVDFLGAFAGVDISGGAGDDDVFGYGQVVSGNINGDAGNDYFVGFSSANGVVTLNGGEGNDVYRYHLGTAATFVEYLGEGIDSVQVARGVSYVLPDEIERISVSGFSGSTSGSATLQGNALDNTVTAHNNADTLIGLGGDDRLFGKGDADTLHGDAGNDYLDGGTANDLLFGGDGNDTLQGRDGLDIMVGGLGDDTYYVDSLSDTVIDYPGEGIDLVRVSVDAYVLTGNIERAILSGTADLSITGNSEANDINGNSGQNSLLGAAGNDDISGGLGDDTLDGGDGDDLLLGGAGGDVLTGGEGADIFVFNSVSDSNSSTGVDEINDFLSNVDLIDLSNIDADSTVSGNQAFTLTGGSSGAAGELWIGVAVGTYTIYGDTDGDGVADFTLMVHPGVLPGSIIL